MWDDIQRYMHNVHKLCGEEYGEAIVVFDGYNESSTKDMVHQRRNKGQVGVAVTFTEEMKLTMRKDTFLTNKTNKQ